MKAVAIITMLLLQLASLTAVDKVRMARRTTVLPPRPSSPCPQKCGEVNIPYPFGIGSNCSFSKEYELACRQSFNPPRPFMVIEEHLEVAEIDLFSAKLNLIVDTMSYSCRNGSKDSFGWEGINLSSRPATFSYTDNVLVVVGCNTEAATLGSRGRTFGCISNCSTTIANNNGPCSSTNGCCQTNLPDELTLYKPTKIERVGVPFDFNPCSYSFLTKKNGYNITPSDLTRMEINRAFPLVFDWVIGNQSCVEAKKSDDYACVSKNSYCLAASNGQGYVCKCSQGYHGNPYRLYGCQDIDECKDREQYPCMEVCTNKPGSYLCSPIPPKSPKKNSHTITGVVVSAVVSTLVAIALTVWIFTLIQKRKLTNLKLKYFLQNGGSVLERRISAAEGIDQSFKIFTMEEIDKATENYNDKLILGRGSQGVVYKGILPSDGRTVAIKKSTVVDKTHIEQFVNEIAILSQINHKNVVRLLGCCLEVEDPLLVYEFVPNGTLSEHIHYQSSSLSPTLPWETRLRIAAETSGAIAYLHSSVSVPIIHRDIKSCNILLDLDFTAKVSDFGISRLIPVDDGQVTTLVRGTLGYLDPEYLQTHHLTDKSDVYSFGTVLVELLTGRKGVISLDRSSGEEERISLSLVFIRYMDEKRLVEILDGRIVNSDDVVSQMEDVAFVARRCLCMRGVDRPTMVEVAMELEGLRRSTVNV